MVVARKRRPQTAHRILDFSGAGVVKPGWDGLAAWIGIRVRIVCVGLSVSKRCFLVGPGGYETDGVDWGWSVRFVRGWIRASQRVVSRRQARCPISVGNTSDRVSGPAPNHASHSSFATFSNPDGNGWLFQEVTTRLPGRVDSATTSFASANDLASALRRAAAAHAEHEKRTRQVDPDWYAGYMVRGRRASRCRNERLS